MLDPTILYGLLGGFGLLFALSALEKYQDIPAFRQQLIDYRILPPLLIPFAAISIIAAEVISATLLITKAYPWGVALGVLIQVTYASGILINLLRGRTHIDCGCLGSRGGGISYFHVASNLLLIGLLAVCTLPLSERPLVWLDYLVIVITVAVCLMVYATMTLLIANHAQQRLWWS